MANRPGGLSTLALALASALLLVGLILGAFLLLSGSSDRPVITLPDESLPTAPPEGGEVEAGMFLQVDAGNVADVVATLTRPASYHQTLTLLTAWTDESAARTAEVWVSGGVTRADITDDAGTKSILTDGQTAYVWYAGEETAAQFSLGESLTADSLTGIPTYEAILTADADAIVQAGFVRLDEKGGRSCIFAQLEADGYVDRYWIDVSTGLLCRATTSRSQTLIYQLREQQCETLLATDEAFATAFCLPDGTSPFSSEQ